MLFEGQPECAKTVKWEQMICQLGLGKRVKGSGSRCLEDVEARNTYKKNMMW